MLQVSGLTVSVSDTPILRAVDFSLFPGEIHAIMGPNGSGKSSLAMTLMGDARYQILDSSKAHVSLAGKDLLAMTPDERARAGLYVAWQNPMTIPGVSVFTLCKTAYEATKGPISSVTDFKNTLVSLLSRVGLGENYLGRGTNEGFSGGEKKRLELLQLLLLEPKVAVLDEIDSGLDIDALKLVGILVTEMAAKDTAFLLITHYKRLLDYVHPSHVHILRKGSVIASGGEELVAKIEEQGYEKIV